MEESKQNPSAAAVVAPSSAAVSPAAAVEAASAAAAPTPIAISDEQLNDRSRLTCLRCGMQFRRSWRMRKAHEMDCEGSSSPTDGEVPAAADDASQRGRPMTMPPLRTPLASSDNITTPSRTPVASSSTTTPTTLPRSAVTTRQRRVFSDERPSTLPSSKKPANASPFLTPATRSLRARSLSPTPSSSATPSLAESVAAAALERTKRVKKVAKARRRQRKKREQQAAAAKAADADGDASGISTTSSTQHVRAMRNKGEDSSQQYSAEMKRLFAHTNITPQDDESESKEKAAADLASPSPSKTPTPAARRPSNSNSTSTSSSSSPLKTTPHEQSRGGSRQSGCENDIPTHSSASTASSADKLTQDSVASLKSASLPNFAPDPSQLRSVAAHLHHVAEDASRKLLVEEAVPPVSASLKVPSCGEFENVTNPEAASPSGSVQEASSSPIAGVQSSASREEPKSSPIQNFPIVRAPLVYSSSTSNESVPVTAPAVDVMATSSESTAVPSPAFVTPVVGGKSVPSQEQQLASATPSDSPATVSSRTSSPQEKSSETSIMSPNVSEQDQKSVASQTPVQSTPSHTSTSGRSSSKSPQPQPQLRARELSRAALHQSLTAATITPPPSASIVNLSKRHEGKKRAILRRQTSLGGGEGVEGKDSAADLSAGTSATNPTPSIPAAPVGSATSSRSKASSKASSKAKKKRTKNDGRTVTAQKGTSAADKKAARALKRAQAEEKRRLAREKLARDEAEKLRAARAKGEALRAQDERARREREERDRVEIQRARKGRGALREATKRREEEVLKQKLQSISTKSNKSSAANTPKATRAEPASAEDIEAHIAKLTSLAISPASDARQGEGAELSPAPSPQHKTQGATATAGTAVRNTRQQQQQQQQQRMRHTMPGPTPTPGPQQSPAHAAAGMTNAQRMMHIQMQMQMRAQSARAGAGHVRAPSGPQILLQMRARHQMQVRQRRQMAAQQVQVLAQQRGHSMPPHALAQQQLHHQQQQQQALAAQHRALALQQQQGAVAQQQQGVVPHQQHSPAQLAVQQQPVVAATALRSNPAQQPTLGQVSKSGAARARQQVLTSNVSQAQQEPVLAAQVPRNPKFEVAFESDEEEGTQSSISTKAKAKEADKAAKKQLAAPGSTHSGSSKTRVRRKSDTPTPTLSRNDAAKHHAAGGKTKKVSPSSARSDSSSRHSANSDSVASTQRQRPIARPRRRSRDSLRESDSREEKKAHVPPQVATFTVPEGDDDFASFEEMEPAALPPTPPPKQRRKSIRQLARESGSKLPLNSKPLAAAAAAQQPPHLPRRSSSTLSDRSRALSSKRGSAVVGGFPPAAVNLPLRGIREESTTSASRPSDDDFWGPGLTPTASQLTTPNLAAHSQAHYPIHPKRAVPNPLTASTHVSRPAMQQSTAPNEALVAQIPKQKVSEPSDSGGVVWSPATTRARQLAPTLTQILGQKSQTMPRQPPTSRTPQTSSLSPTMPRARSSASPAPAAAAAAPRARSPLRPLLDRPDPAGTPSAPEPAAAAGRVREAASHAHVIRPRSYKAAGVATKGDASAESKSAYVYGGGSRVPVLPSKPPVRRDVSKEPEKFEQKHVAGHADESFFEEAFPEESPDLWDAFDGVIDSVGAKPSVAKRAESALSPHAIEVKEEKEQPAAIAKKAKKQRKKDKKSKKQKKRAGKKRESSAADIESYFHVAPSPAELANRGAFDEPQVAEVAGSEAAAPRFARSPSETERIDQVEEARLAFEAALASSIHEEDDADTISVQVPTLPTLQRQATKHKRSNSDSISIGAAAYIASSFASQTQSRRGSDSFVSTQASLGGGGGGDFDAISVASPRTNADGTFKSALESALASQISPPSMSVNIPRSPLYDSAFRADSLSSAHGRVPFEIMTPHPNFVSPQSPSMSFSFSGYAHEEHDRQLASSTPKPVVEDAVPAAPAAVGEEEEEEEWVPPHVRRRRRMETLERERRENPALVRRSSITSVASVDVRDKLEERERKKKWAEVFGAVDDGAESDAESVYSEHAAVSHHRPSSMKGGLSHPKTVSDSRHSPAHGPVPPPRPNLPGTGTSASRLAASVSPPLDSITDLRAGGGGRSARKFRLERAHQWHENSKKDFAASSTSTATGLSARRGLPVPSPKNRGARRASMPDTSAPVFAAGEGSGGGLPPPVFHRERSNVSRPPHDPTQTSHPPLSHAALRMHTRQFSSSRRLSRRASLSSVSSVDTVLPFDDSRSISSLSRGNRGLPLPSHHQASAGGLPLPPRGGGLPLPPHQRSAAPAGNMVPPPLPAHVAAEVVSRN